MSGHLVRCEQSNGLGIIQLFYVRTPRSTISAECISVQCCSARPWPHPSTLPCPTPLPSTVGLRLHPSFPDTASQVHATRVANFFLQMFNAIKHIEALNKLICKLRKYVYGEWVCGTMEILPHKNVLL
jgi:hypothetical protein